MGWKCSGEVAITPSSGFQLRTSAGGIYLRGKFTAPGLAAHVLAMALPFLEAPGTR